MMDRDPDGPDRMPDKEAAMAINVTPIPGLDPEINDIRRRTADFVNTEILPNEEVLWRSRRDQGQGEDEREVDRRRSIELRESIKAKVNEAGLWAPHLPKEYGGMGLDFLATAYMYEILAYAVGASTLFGIAAPNSGNATILVKYGTEEQKRKWLLPLIDGTMQSGFSMTEPDNAGSDPRSIRTEAVREGSQWRAQGIPQHPRGWLITVASRRLTDLLRSDQARRRREDTLARWQLPLQRSASDADTGPADSDDTLILLVLCAHPALDTAAQIALTLRALAKAWTKRARSAATPWNGLSPPSPPWWTRRIRIMLRP